MLISAFAVLLLLGMTIMINSLMVTGKAVTVTKEDTKMGDLQCYECHSMFDGENCVNVSTNSTTRTNCPDGYGFCMSRKFSYILQPGEPKFWSIERNCSKSCEEFCIAIGERTKIFMCKTCCKNDLCNFGDSTTSLNNFSLSWFMLIIISFINMIFSWVQSNIFIV